MGVTSFPNASHWAELTQPFQGCYSGQQSAPCIPPFEGITSPLRFALPPFEGGEGGCPSAFGYRVPGITINT